MTDTLIQEYINKLVGARMALTGETVDIDTAIEIIDEVIEELKGY